MPLHFMNRIRNGYGNIYTPHAGSMIIQVQRENGLANRTIVLTQRQVAFLRVLGSRLGIVAVVVFLGSWLLFAAQSVRVPALSGRIAELERDNARLDSLQVALSRIHGRYEQVRVMLATVGTLAPRGDSVSPRPGVKPANAPPAAVRPAPAIQDSAGRNAAGSSAR